MPSRFIANEVWFQIFQELEKKQVFTCMLVCKSWYLPAVKSYYQDITIKENKMKDLQQKLLTYGNGYWTNKLTMVVDKDNFGIVNQDSRLEVEEFLLLLSLLPRLKSLNLSNSAYHHYYMGILRDEITTLTCIEEITSLTYHTLYQELHFEVCYNFRKSIKRLVTFANEYRIRDEIHDFLHYLPQFNQLTELSIYNDRQKDLTIFDILNECKYLTKFRYSSYFPVPLVKAEKQQAQCKNNKYLKSIHLNIPTITKAYIQFLIYQCNENILETLILNIQSTNLYRWLIQQQDEVILTSFTIAASKLNNLQITCNPKQIPNITPIKMRLYYDFILKLKGNRNLYCDATFAESGSNHIMIDIQNDQKLLKFTCGMLNNDPSLFIDKNQIINSLKFIIVNQQQPSLLLPTKNILKYYTNSNYTRLDQLSINCNQNQSNFSFNKSWCNNKITLSKFNLSQDTINTITCHLPNIETIEFMYPTYTSSLDTTCLDLSRFLLLKQFYFDISSLNNIYLQFNFDSSTFCYQVNNNSCQLINHQITDNSIPIIHFKCNSTIEEIVLVNENKTLIQLNPFL